MVFILENASEFENINHIKIDGILPKGPYPPCLRMADRALLAGNPRNSSCHAIKTQWFSYKKMHQNLRKYQSYKKSMVSCQKGPTRHAYAWQIGPFWQETLEIAAAMGLCTWNHVRWHRSISMT